MIDLSMQNSMAEISNQVDLENDIRWMGEGDIQALLLMLNVSQGGWAVLVKARAGSTMPTHYHTDGLYVFTVYGHWHYPEHSDWQAKTGHFLFESPGELHTPTFIEDTMLYSIIPGGALLYPNEKGMIEGMSDVHSHLRNVRVHYEQVGLTEADVQKIMR